jgi:hypothetical protein
VCVKKVSDLGKRFEGLPKIKHLGMPETIAATAYEPVEFVFDGLRCRPQP